MKKRKRKGKEEEEMGGKKEEEKKWLTVHGLRYAVHGVMNDELTNH